MVEEEGGAPTEKRSDRTKAAILQAARLRLASHGYDRTTIRAVAADAGIDPSMVMRYFVSKAQLFDAALDIDLRLPDLTGVPLDDLPGTLVRLFLQRWEVDPADDALLVLLRSAVTNTIMPPSGCVMSSPSRSPPALARAVGDDLARRTAGLWRPNSWASG